MKYKTIILASSRDLCSCPLTSSLATCLWPVVGVSVIERLLSGLSVQGVDEAVVCSNGCGDVINATIDKSKCPSLTFLDEPVRVGTAGCIRDAVAGDSHDSDNSDDTDESLLVVLQGSMVSPPCIDELLTAHKDSGAELTVFFNPEGEEKLATGNWKLEARRSRQGEGAGVYVCNSSVLEHIPPVGYLDIKESLISNLLAAEKKVCHAVLPGNVNNFRSRGEYLLASADGFNGLEGNGLEKYAGHDDVWVGRGGQIDSDARLVGPVAVLDGAKVEKGAVLIGPAVVGRNAVVGRGSVLVKSILWDGALVGSGCRLSEVVVADGVVVEDDTNADGVALAVRGCGFLESIMRKVFK